ncbi:Bug family tripartite tricarboxylate transporter substrate binding protein [Hydrogenophaga sp. BPS33]|uniref:Bug family tripartite tricarboxylate transporter substrate binding protein n=1 Tax=Hydrogenophaga sp. BPS33 TaxID=2651974 RepID=UPI001320117C|nr:tripartite tricarboxylate transporter substrate binding protein [Hydrogenophaga sp. BPS33]QHE87318.1 tripartite tricarboxylate transporter substrate binding protein [Hydrogenophaga sp. BPS33]
MPSSHRRIALATGLAALVLATTATWAQTASSWPNRPVRIVNPASPGGTADALTRIVADKLSADLGQPFILDFRAGANGIIGNDHVAKALPDGYTLLLCNSAMVANASLYTKLPYDTAKDFAPVSHFFETPYFLFVSTKLEARSLRELVALARNAPGKLTYSSSGIGSTPHLTGVQFAQKAGTSLMHVPYKGSAPAVTATASGETDLLFMSLPATRKLVEDGRLRLLGTTSAERSSFAPEAPTIAEAGLPPLVASAWFGFCAPAATPVDVQERFAAALVRAMAQPDVRQRFHDAGAVPTANNPAAFRAFFQKSITDTASVVKASGARLE